MNEIQCIAIELVQGNRGGANNLNQVFGDFVNAKTPLCDLELHCTIISRVGGGVAVFYEGWVFSHLLNFIALCLVASQNPLPTTYILS